MAILVDRNTRVIIQGITGREATSFDKDMLDYGTQVVAGVTPGKGGQEVLGKQIFNNAREAVAAIPEINCAVMYVPAGAVKGAAMDAMDAGLKFSVLTADGVATLETEAEQDGRRIIRKGKAELRVG